MNRKFLTVTSLVALICHAPAFADGHGKSVAERLADLERRIQRLEQRVVDQNKVIVEKDRLIHKLGARVEETAQAAEAAAASHAEEGAHWSDSVEITGLIEVEGGYEDPYEGDSESDAVVATVELGVAARMHDWVSGEIVLLFEEDENDDNIDVDIATLTIAPPDGPWAITGGRTYLPFGVFESNMISDSLTLELGETRDTTFMLSVEGENLYGSAFLYNGENSEDGDNRLDNLGVALGYAMEGDGTEFGLDVAYVDDIGDTDALQDAVSGNLVAAGLATVSDAVDRTCLAESPSTNQDVLDCIEKIAEEVVALSEDDVPATYADKVSGIAASARFRYGDVALMAEYLAATERFQADALSYGGSLVTNADEEMEYQNRGAKPSSWMIEAGYDFMIGTRAANLAIGMQGTDDAVGLELPKTRFMLAGSIELAEGVALGVEWAHDEDYDTDESANCSYNSDDTETECGFVGTDENADTITVQLAAEF